MLKRLFGFAALVSAAPAFADITPEADACIDALRAQHGNVGGEVLDQLFSEAAIMVLLRDSHGTDYECIVWSGPVVADLRVAGEGPMADVGGGTIQGADTPAMVSGTQQVRFAAGTIGTAMSGTLASNTSVNYVIGARDGQILNVDVSSLGGALDYSITNPDGSVLLDLISSDTPYRGQLWQTGDHVITVLNAGAQQVIFDIGIGIK